MTSKPHHGYAAQDHDDEPTPRLRIVRFVMIHLTEIEANYLDEMRRRGGFTSDADVAKCALWHLARHLDLIVAPPIFAIGDATGEP